MASEAAGEESEHGEDDTEGLNIMNRKNEQVQPLASHSRHMLALTLIFIVQARKEVAAMRKEMGM
jgi:hypothetical protein